MKNATINQALKELKILKPKVLFNGNGVIIERHISEYSNDVVYLITNDKGEAKTTIHLYQARIFAVLLGAKNVNLAA